MKILFITPWYPNPDNPTLGNFIIRQAELLAEEHEVFLLAFSPVGQAQSPFEENSIQIGKLQGYHYLYPAGGRASLLGRLRSRQAALQRVQRAGFSPELLHGQILHHSGDLLYYFKKQFAVPVVCTEHWSGHLAERNAKMSAWELIRFELAKRSVDLALPVTQQLQQSLQMKGLQAEVWRNPVDRKLFYPQETKAFDFMHLSTLDANKRPLDILQAFYLVWKKHPQARLSIGGDGPLSPLIDKKKALQLPDEAVEIHGTLTYQEAAQRMRASRCLVQFSGYENLPCTIGEALMAGLWVITSNVGGIKELVNEKNGNLVGKNAPEELMNAMCDFLEKHPSPPPFQALDTSHLLVVYRQLIAPVLKH